MFGFKSKGNTMQNTKQNVNNSNAKPGANIHDLYLPLQQMGNPNGKLMSFVNRVKGVNRVGYGNTRSEQKWIANKRSGKKNTRKLLGLQREYHKPLALNNWSKYRTANVAKAIYNVPKAIYNMPRYESNNEIPLENTLGPRQPKLETGGSKTRRNKKSRR